MIIVRDVDPSNQITLEDALLRKDNLYFGMEKALPNQRALRFFLVIATGEEDRYIVVGSKNMMQYGKPELLETIFDAYKDYTLVAYETTKALRNWLYPKEEEV